MVGSNGAAAQCASIFSSRQSSSREVVGIVSRDDSGHLRFYTESGEREVESLDDILNGHAIDEVLQVETGGTLESTTIRFECAVRGITFKTLMRSPLGTVGRYSTERVGKGEYILAFETVPERGTALALKRVIDIIAALVGLVVCGLVYLRYARRLRKESGGSPFFSQIRVGRNGRTFKLFKFRTMNVSAEDRLPELMQRNEMKGHLFKMTDDPRVTAIGRFLRRHHIDELPQFWNVLKGEMSLVGTRPPTQNEVAGYSSHHQRRLSMKPGITGLWQIQGGGKIVDFEEVVSLDCRYIDNWSLLNDFKIIVGTILKVCRGDGC